VLAAPPKLNIRPNDRLFFAGRTGSGKTTLAKGLLNGVAKFVVIDPKHTFTMSGIPTKPHFDKNLDRQIVRVPMYDKRKDKRRTAEMERFADVINDVWKAGNRVLYIDELTLVTRPRPLLPELAKAIRTGRERGLGVWTGSQRPTEIPSEVFTESEHIFVFQLGYMRDRMKVTHFTTDAIYRVMEGLRGHSFAYYNVRDNRMERFKPIVPTL
jgi:DNA helicase HerA-like ATPase